MVAGKKILVVDDESDLREILRDEFELEGAIVDEAANGKEAFNKVLENQYDLVVTDIRMPGGDGISLAKKIKALNVEKPGVILITGFADILPEEAYDLGVEVFHSKPFNLEEFRGSIEMLLMPLGQRYKAVQSKDRSPGIEVAPELEEALDRGEMQLGRGGAFFKTDQVLWRVGDEVPLTVGSQPVGIGKVRWVRSDSGSELPLGVGIEFMQLNKPFVDVLQDWLVQHHPTSFIPRS